MKLRAKLRQIFYVKKPWWRYPLVIIFILFFLTGATLAYKALSLTHTVIVKGISSTISGNRLGVTELKGEKEGRVNILFLGIGVEGQSGAELTDTIILASFDLKNNNVSLVSIPRDLYVKIPEVGYDKINATYSYGSKISYNGGGGALVRDTVSNISGVPIHYYVVMDFDGFKEIVDALGGIDIKVEKDIYDYEYPSKNERGYSPFILEKGDYHMDGELALKYVRSRKSTSDFDRARRQQQVILAIRDKAFEKKIITNPKRIYELYNALEKHVKTDFQLSEIARVVELAQKFKLENINTTVLDDSQDGYLYADNINGMYALRPRNNDFSAIQEFIHYFIFEEPLIKKENAKVEILNGAGRENLAKAVSEKLRNYGLNIVETGSADRYDYSRSIIYDQSEGTKSHTVSFLANYFSAQVIKQKKSKDNEMDITVIIGQDYDEEW